MFFEQEVIYSKRYPPAGEVLEKLLADTTLPVIPPTQAETSFRNFCSRMNSNPILKPIPGKAEKAREFIALAKKFSEDYEVDIDIRRSACSVKASLHLYCSAYSKDMTRQFARLFHLCDNLSSFVLESEPSDFTLVLELDTHKHCLSDMMMNDF